ncbi:hypothetical protein GJ699_31905 [Duganella sp. FT80W]|uniref:Uncharacterized protein n=1 Tax=Duganella guangzhouensis TaxID=2666084 RepID=A0A6I2LA33_9BURK|nr:hypothetical protein [Duganella guangzhouensis]MRW94582.1 hypothetical protein [Duganella guangzhouensis]
MLRLSMLIVLALAASIGHAEADLLADLTKGQPKDVAAIAARIATCAHFSGEESYDTARRREIAAAMKKYRCETLEKDEAVVRRRYKDNPAVLGILQKAHEW